MIKRIKSLLILICMIVFPCTSFAAGTVNDEVDVQHLLDSIRNVAYSPEKNADWLKVVDSIVKLGDLGIPEAKPVLIDILRREAPVQLEAGVPLPGIMPPLEMIKAAAIDSLVKLGAKESLSAIEKIAQTSSFQVLREKAQRAVSALQNP
jgi:HEAT repeat protein